MAALRCSRSSCCGSTTPGPSRWRRPCWRHTSAQLTLAAAPARSPGVGCAAGLERSKRSNRPRPCSTVGRGIIPCGPQQRHTAFFELFQRFEMGVCSAKAHHRVRWEIAQGHESQLERPLAALEPLSHLAHASRFPIGVCPIVRRWSPKAWPHPSFDHGFFFGFPDVVHMAMAIEDEIDERPGQPLAFQGLGCRLVDRQRPKNRKVDVCVVLLVPAK